MPFQGNAEGDERKPRSSLDEDIAKMKRLIFGGAECDRGKGNTAKRSRLYAGETHSPGVVERKRGKVSVLPSPGGSTPPVRDSAGSAEEDEGRSSSANSIDLSLDPPLSLSALVQERSWQTGQPEQPHRQGGCGPWASGPVRATTTPWRPAQRHSTSPSPVVRSSPAGSMAFAFMQPEEAYARIVERHRRWALTRAPLHEPNAASTVVVDSPDRSPVQPEGPDDSGDCVIPSTTRWTLRTPVATSAGRRDGRPLPSPSSLTRRLRQALSEGSPVAGKGATERPAGGGSSSSSSPTLRVPARTAVPFVTPALRRTPSPPPPPPTPPPPAEERMSSPARELSWRVSPRHRRPTQPTGTPQRETHLTGSVSALRVYYRRLGAGLRITPPLPHPC